MTEMSAMLKFLRAPTSTLKEKDATEVTDMRTVVAMFSEITAVVRTDLSSSNYPDIRHSQDLQSLRSDTITTWFCSETK